MVNAALRGRDMTATGRYPPQPKFQPFAFYSAVRLGDPEQLELIMSTDPYFWTQDNGAGAPIHFATTYKQLDMAHHILRNAPESINLRDPKGFTPLHRAAYLAQFDGYLEMFEYLLSEGADPSIQSEDYDPYLNPGPKTPLQLVENDPEVHARLVELVEQYAHVEKKPQPNPALSDWWALYDYGYDEVRTWPKDFVKEYPEDRRRAQARRAKEEFKARRRVKRAQIEAEIEAEIAERRAVEKPDLTLGSENAAILANAVEFTKPHAMEHSKGPGTEKGKDSAFLFPGQGSQVVGMLKDDKLMELPAVSEMCRVAEKVLGYDLRAVCVEGPKEKLDDTVYAQPALLLANLVALEKLKDEDPQAVASCDACAGLSLGEYAALVFAGILSYEDAFKVVKARAEGMSAAAAVGAHGMLSIVGLDDATLEKIVSDALQKVKSGGGGDDVVCEITNFLFPQGRVVSGDKSALEVVQEAAQAAGAIKVATLAVSGAFHTSRMESASQKLREALDQATFNKPRVSIYSNITGAPIALDTPADEIRELLAKQLVSPVKWEQTLKNLMSDGKKKFYELGPNAQIKSMTKRVSLDAWKTFKNVDVSK
jgi:[acyl-carrier-protein] S-malonyltransferase